MTPWGARSRGDRARFWRNLVLAAVSLIIGEVARAQSVTNVKAQQLADRTVEVLYDLSGAAASGSTVGVAFSSDGGTTYSIVPAAGALSGHVGTGVPGGADRRIVWTALKTLPVGTLGTTFRALVTATNPAPAARIEYTLGGGVKLALRLVPAGTFLMGAYPNERGANSFEVPRHQVTLTKDTYVGETPVTQQQWEAVMGAGTNPSGFCGSHGLGPNHPVTCVTRDDVAEAGGFLETANQLLHSTGQLPSGQSLRLPTEAEFERAARGGTQTRFFFGDALECIDSCAPCASADPFLWWCANATSAQPVGTKQPNPYGLYDMHGNVFEWCQDWFGPYPSSAQTDPQGLPSGQFRVWRGGYWNIGLVFSRSSYRQFSGPEYRDFFLGFRVARTGDPAASSSRTPEVSSSPSNLFALDLRVGILSLGPSPLNISPGATAGLAASLSQSEAAGVILALTSSNSSVASVPANVVLAAGSLNTSFNATGVASGDATITATLPPNLGGASATASVHVAVPIAPQPLTLCLRAVPTVSSGRNLTTVIGYGNSGSTSVSGVVIKDALPSGVTFLTATDGGALSNGVITWNLGSLGSQAIARTVSFTVAVTAPSGTITNGTCTIEATGIPPLAGQPVSTAVSSTCVPPPGALLLSSGRVAVTATFQSQYDLTKSCAGPASAIPQSDGFGYFHFGDPANPELFVKALDFGGPTYLVFFGTLSDLQLSVTFTNLQTCESVVFTKPAGGSCGVSDGSSLKK